MRRPRLKVTYCYTGGRTHDRLAACLELIQPGCLRGKRVWICEHNHHADEATAQWSDRGYAEVAALACGVEAFKLVHAG